MYPILRLPSYLGFLRRQGIGILVNKPVFHGVSLVRFDHWSTVRTPKKMPNIAFQPPIVCQPILFAVVVLGWLLTFWVPFNTFKKNRVFL